MTEEAQPSEFAEIDFPIILMPSAEKSSVEQKDRPLSTWADNGISWDAGL
jgi:hypothetical protein